MFYLVPNRPIKSTKIRHIVPNFKIRYILEIVTDLCTLSARVRRPLGSIIIDHIISWFYVFKTDKNRLK